MYLPLEVARLTSSPDELQSDEKKLTLELNARGRGGLVGRYIRFRTPYDFGRRISAEQWPYAVILGTLVDHSKSTRYTMLDLDGPFVWQVFVRNTNSPK